MFCAGSPPQRAERTAFIYADLLELSVKAWETGMLGPLRSTYTLETRASEADTPRVTQQEEEDLGREFRASETGQ